MWFKKDVVLHAYTCRAEIFDHAKIYRAVAKKPEWWKSLKNCKDDDPEPNMKSCVGINEMYNNSIVLPLWSDLIFEYDGVGGGDWRYQFADETSVAKPHNPTSYNGWADKDNYQHMKLSSPWKIECDSNVNFLCTNAAYENESPLDWFVPNGMLSFNRQNGVDVNMFFKRDAAPKKVFIRYNTPILMLVPLTERKVRVEHHLISDEEWVKLTQRSRRHLAFQKSYYKIKKCPFSGVKA